MKKIILCFVILTSVQTHSQNDTLKNKEDAEYLKLNNEMSVLARHKKLTQFSDIPYNFVSSRIQDYMRDHMNMNLISDDVKDSKIILIFEEMVTFVGSPKKLRFTFNVYEKESFFIIKDCKITGHRDKLTYFYVHYWPQNMHSDDLKPGTFKTMCLNDDSYLYLKGESSYIQVKKR
jgi:hypothetical protein